MVLPSFQQLSDQLKHELNPFERFTDLLSGRDDRQDIMILLLYNIAALLAGQPEEGQGTQFPTGLNVNVPIKIDTTRLIDKRKALTTDVILSDTLADCRKAIRMVITVDNGYDQAVSCDIVGNISNVTDAGVKVIATINIPAGESRGYGISEGEWYPWLGVQLTPAGVPTTGEANASLIQQLQGAV